MQIFELVFNEHSLRFHKFDLEQHSDLLMFIEVHNKKIKQNPADFFARIGRSKFFLEKPPIALTFRNKPVGNCGNCVYYYVDIMLIVF